MEARGQHPLDKGLGGAYGCAGDGGPSPKRALRDMLWISALSSSCPEWLLLGISGDGHRALATCSSALCPIPDLLGAMAVWPLLEDPRALAVSRGREPWLQEGQEASFKKHIPWQVKKHFFFLSVKT